MMHLLDSIQVSAPHQFVIRHIIAVLIALSCTCIELESFREIYLFIYAKTQIYSIIIFLRIIFLYQIKLSSYSYVVRRPKQNKQSGANQKVFSTFRITCQ